MPLVTYYGSCKYCVMRSQIMSQFWDASVGSAHAILGPNTHAHHREKVQLHQFLMGLHDETYEMVISNLLSQDPLPTQEEQVRGSKTKEERD